MKKKDIYVVVINGPATSGKDSFITLFRQICPRWVGDCSYADCVKDLFENNFVVLPKNEKTEKTRKFFADFLVLWEQYNNGPMNRLETAIEHFFRDIDRGVLFVVRRNPKDIQYLKDKYDACTLLVTRPGVEPIQSNDDDKNVLEYEYDYRVINDGTLDQLQDKAYEFYMFLRDHWKPSGFQYK